MNGIPSTRPPIIAASTIACGSACGTPSLTPERRSSRRSVMKRFIVPAFYRKATNAAGDRERMRRGHKYLLNNDIKNVIPIIHAIHRNSKPTKTDTTYFTVLDQQEQSKPQSRRAVSRLP